MNNEYLGLENQGIMNKTFVYVLPDTFSTEALYLCDEIFVFVKSVGKSAKENYVKTTNDSFRKFRLGLF